MEFDKEYYLFCKANVIISFNNRPATEAVPYFEQVNFYFIFFTASFFLAFYGNLATIMIKAVLIFMTQKMSVV